MIMEFPKKKIPDGWEGLEGAEKNGLKSIDLDLFAYLITWDDGGTIGDTHGLILCGKIDTYNESGGADRKIIGG